MPPWLEVVLGICGGLNVIGLVVWIVKTIYELKATDMMLTKAVADAHGMALGAAHAITEPHQYSWPEFQAATRGMTNRQAAQAWEMQHYLNPQQQAVAGYLSGLTNQANASHPDGGAAKDGGAADKQLQQVLHMITTGMPAQ